MKKYSNITVFISAMGHTFLLSICKLHFATHILFAPCLVIILRLVG